MHKRLFVFLMLVALTVKAQATPIGFVHVRIVDVGPGLCCIVELPGNKYMIYDAGINSGMTREDQNLALVAIQRELEDMIPRGEDIDLMVVSHQHTDHFSGIELILNPYFGHSLKQLLINGYEHSTSSLDDQFDYIPGFINLKTFIDNDNNDGIYLIESPDTVQEIDIGHIITIAEGVTLTLLSGYGEPQWNQYSKPNFTSNVIKLEFHNTSVLFTGDTIGSTSTLHAANKAEEVMVANHNTNPALSLKSNVVIAPHHGSHSSSSTQFIEAIDPDYVIFSCGHMYDHPSQDTAGRYLQHLQTKNFDESHMFRTDLGDDERDAVGFTLEWDYRRIDGHIDQPGDDNVDIWLFENGYVYVNYVFR